MAGGAGTLPNDYPAPKPWDQPAGDYCSAYKFSQPSAPTTAAPLATVSDVDLGGVTGFDPGLPRESFQLRHNAQADSSACQAKGAVWGFWTNANTANNYCGSPEFRSSRGVWARLRTEIPYGMGVSGAAGARRVDFA